MAGLSEMATRGGGPAKAAAKTARALAVAAAAVAAIAATGTGCGGGDDGTPAPIGQQILTGRDFSNLFFWGGGTLVFTRDAAVPGAGGADQDLWIWPADAAAPEIALTQIDWSPPVWWPDIIVGDILMTGGNGERVYDLEARAAVDLTIVGIDPNVQTVLDYSAVRSDGGVIVASREAFTGGIGPTPPAPGLLFGRAPSFSQSSPLLVIAFDFMGPDLALIAATDVAPTAPASLFRMQLSPGTLTPGTPTPGTLTPLPVPAFDHVISAQCGAYRTSPCPLFRVVGCSNDVAPCPGSDQPPCSIFYERPSADAPQSMTPYVFDVVSGQEVALPGVDPSQFSISPDQHRVAWTHSDLDDQRNGLPGSDMTNVYFRYLCAGTVGQCSVARPQRLGWRSDGSLLTIDRAANQLDVVSFPGGQCGSFFSGATDSIGTVLDHQFSPDNQSIVWRSSGASDQSGTVLSSRNLSGTAVLTLAEGDLLSYGFSGDGRRMFLTRATGGELTLSWIDPTQDHPAESSIAGAFSDASIRGNRRVLLIDRWNTQDGSGTLELVDLDAGGRQVLARSVSDFTVDASVDGPARVVYVVHGRYASGRDGLWQTTLSAPP
jgi:hypothetical protein